MRQFDNYRLVLTPETLAAAVADFKARHGKLPAGLTVHKSKVQDALAILSGGVKLLPVTATGGCLSTEFWLENGEGE